MAGTIRPDAINVSTTPILSSKTLPSPALVIKTAEKRTVTAPRIDVEPLYTAVKSAVGDADWAVYKTATSEFLLGKINQEELTRRLSPILNTPALEHAHNQLVCAIYGNIFRDAPEPGVASWVSANDKPTTSTKPTTGDKAEKRLKAEVMQLSRRERKRLKTVQEGSWDPFSESMKEYSDLRKIKAPDTGPASAGGFQKTNWDLEIRKRYTQPLFSETHEFPDADTIASRMLPICYEAGLPSGHASDCAAFMNTATETYIKEALMNFFERVSANGAGHIRTAEFKRKVEREEEKVARGEISRSAAGLLPIEVEEERKRRPLCMEDLRVALQLGDPFLGQVPLISSAITNSNFLDTQGIESLANEGPSKSLTNGVVSGIGPPNQGSAGMVNGMNGVNGWNVELGDPMVIDDEWGWQGGGVQDVDGLDSVLDGCLAIGV
ncbi:hypothetical protein P154DRAFT_575114 [Amniculicola lignicola CBS 123094]|uniref:Transcriptional co-activator n=1 Tax=Amniculicola lignicola CBS 123094 TaxID=1392246 RepID=A0A6A5WHS8_9PLEO|nr:hypothetical protein P154DRAFT_575114 [Amniculicola lignicola CBS 123094]